MKNFKGVIIAESLQDKSVLNKLLIIKTDIEIVTKSHQTPWLKQWTLHTVEIPFDTMDETAKEIQNSLEKQHNWYAHFWNNDSLCVIFRDKIYKLPKDDKNTWQEAIEYGISLGIPKQQLEFPTD